MASKKVGTLIKEARTGADLTQEQLARKIKGLSASDISLAERGQKELTQAQLKEIAKVTAAEKKILELYRAADSETKKDVLKLLKGEQESADSVLESLLGVVQGMLEEK